MGRKPKPLPFKKGMKVVWMSHGYGIYLTEGEVTVVTTKDGAPLVHARHVDQHGNVWRRSFSTIAGMFQENPYPIWQLRPLNGDNIKNLQRRAEKANRLRNEYENAYQAMQREVHNEAQQWERQEIEKRKKSIPHGDAFVTRVKARMGFKRPKLVRVRVNGEITTTRG
jgi:hypothetical protein